MRKFLSIILFIFLTIPALASSNINASDYEDFDSAWAKQKVIPENEYEETVKALEEQKNSKETKEQQKKLKKFKGESLHKELDAGLDNLPNQTIKNPDEDEQILLIPVDITVDDKTLERGYYHAVGERKDGIVYINLYQAHSLIAQIKTQETEDDFGEMDIAFIKLIPYKENILKLIYGSVAANAYAFIHYKEPVAGFTPQ